VRFRAIPLARAAAVAALALVLASCGGGGKSSSGTTGPTTTGAGKQIVAALVSDIGKFNDRGFNQSQLAGLNRAKAQLGIKGIALQSNSESDYIPNLTSAVRQHADIVIAAGFLLANSVKTMAKKFPDTHFAITDQSYKDAGGFKNVQGLTYAANESGCLVGVLAAKMAQRMGKEIIGAVMGVKIPPVDIWTAGYRFCAQKAVPGTKVLTGYSNDFVATDKCKTVAQQQLSQGAQVLFQVAGGCGLGTLKAADEAGKWGIGVDVDQYNLAHRVLTSAVKRVDVGVFQAIKQVQDGKWNGGHDLLFDLKNGGMGIGRINPAVPASDIRLMNKYKAEIISGKLKVPSTLG
jgi:basic membrane protein A and related proteins